METVYQFSAQQAAKAARRGYRQQLQLVVPIVVVATLVQARQLSGNWVALLLGIVIGCGLGILFLIWLRQRKQRALLRLKLTLTAAGLSWQQDTQQPISLTWEQVGYRKGAAQGLLLYNKGRTAWARQWVEVPPELDEFAALQQQVAQHATVG